MAQSAAHDPPQSMAVSLPFLMPSLQLGVGGELLQPISTRSTYKFLSCPFWLRSLVNSTRSSAEPALAVNEKAYAAYAVELTVALPRTTPPVERRKLGQTPAATVPRANTVMVVVPAAKVRCVEM